MLAPFQGFLHDRLEVRPLSVGTFAFADAATELDDGVYPKVNGGVDARDPLDRIEKLEEQPRANRVARGFVKLARVVRERVDAERGELRLLEHFPELLSGVDHEKRVKGAFGVQAHAALVRIERRHLRAQRIEIFRFAGDYRLVR